MPKKEPEDGFMVTVLLFHICSFVIIHESSQIFTFLYFYKTRIIGYPRPS